MTYSYVYALVDPREPEHIRYVGITTRELHGYITRRNKWWASARCKRSRHVECWSYSLAQEGISTVYRVIESGEMTWSELCDAEKWWIAHLRSTGHRLTNATDGGDGVVGHAQLHTSERNTKVSVGVKQSFVNYPTLKQRQADARRETMLERYGSLSTAPFVKGDVGKSWRGKTLPDDVKRKMSEAQKRKWERIRAEGRYDEVRSNIASATKVAMNERKSHE